MSTIVTRSGKGSPLTNNEVDANFTNLNTDKVQVTGTPTTGQAIVWNGTAWVPGASAVYPGAGIPVSTGTAWGTSYGTSGATSVVLRDANVNVSANTFFTGFSNVAAAGTTTVLTVSSVYNWVVTGSGGQTYQLPDATTLPNGAVYTFNNNQSSGTIVVKNNSGTTVATIQSGAFLEVLLLSNSIAAGSWDTHNQAPSNVSWSTNTFSYSGSFTSGTWNGNVITGAYGGTGVNNGTNTITIAGNVTHAGAFTQTFTATANSSVTIPTSGTLISSVTALPGAVTGTPSSSNFLRGDGTWATAGSPPAGSSTQVQFNNSGSFGASSSFTWDGTSLNAPIHNASNGLYVNSQTISASYTIAAGTSAMSVGPVTIASGQTVTLGSGARWVIL